MELLQFGRRTLWAGLPVSEAHPATPEGAIALGQLASGGTLQTKDGLTIECLRSQGVVIGYGVIFSRGPQKLSEPDDLNTMLLWAREALREYRICSGTDRITLGINIIDVAAPWAA